MQIKTTFAPGYPDLFGGIAYPYIPVKEPNVMPWAHKKALTPLDHGMAAFIHKNPLKHATEIAESMGVTRDSAYWRIRCLEAKGVIKFERKLSPDGMRRKHWFCVKPTGE